MTEVMAIIPARGGSKGIPRKNLALCAGRPLVDWVLEAASGSKLLTRRVLSSDSAEILDRGRWFAGVSPMLRPVELAGDETSTEAVMEHVIEQSPPADVYVLLQPTSPLTESRHIDEAVGLVLEQGTRNREQGVDSVVSVVRSHALTWRRGEPQYLPFARPRRQEMDQFEENGAIYVTTADRWGRSGIRFDGRVELYEMDEEHRVQVDTPFDLELASWLLRRRKEANEQRGKGANGQIGKGYVQVADPSKVVLV